MEFHEIKELWAETIAGEDTRDKGKATTMLHAFRVCWLPSQSGATGSVVQVGFGKGGGACLWFLCFTFTEWSL